MRYSVCMIDNDIPASGAQAQELGINDTSLLNSSNLQLLLQAATWEDQVVKNLAQTLLTQTDDDGISRKWDVYGFTNPSFYINAINDGFFRSDVVIFDWEYPGAQNASATNSESHLKDILDKTFCLIFIFSKADKKEEIDAILAKPEFQQYKERLQYLDKAIDNVDQTGALLQKADEMYGSNFSFTFASLLRKRSVQCADRILSDMGRASLNDVKNLLVVGHGGKKDFIDFLAERFRTTLAGPTVYELVDQIPHAALADGIDADLASKVWSYRLYFQQEPGDDLVRRGDIVSVGDEVLFVLSADCDLMRFWQKNLGIINAVTLHELDQSNETLKAMLALCTKPKLADSRLGSLLAKIGDLSEGPFVLPFVPTNERKIKNFVAIPKDLTSRRVPTPEGWNEWGKEARKAHPMRYPYWAGARRLCTVSEPFLTPVIQHVFNAIGGNGVPDYPDHMKDVLKKILEDFAATKPAVGAPLATAPAGLDEKSIVNAGVEPLAAESASKARDSANTSGSPAEPAVKTHPEETL